jgi:DNA invertase Pin-like site-specific DNA recombinase
VRYEKRPNNDAEPASLRAAQYVRMSTDHQKYSTQNQAEVIAAYAARRHLSIVRTYADEGRSGLRLDGRDALQGLIEDARCGRADFGFILVYDVSRWGRFQDADESAYYEFICKQAGIKVLYCAEEFENDGSLFSTMYKNMKRAMAGEFSRDLSTKVFIGQCRITTLGFWHGGLPSYGLRRELVDERGISKGQLEYGQQKSLQTDRVILKPGPSFEVKTVRRVFRSFVAKRKCVTEIAAELNADQILTSRGNRWSAQTIDKILTNEKYVGNIVFNRISYKLKQRPVANPPDMWVRRDNALEAIIAPEIFLKAQQIISQRRQRLSDQETLDRLSALWREKGYLTDAIIVASKNVPATSTYIKRFGSLTAAYKLIGFQPKPRYRWADTEARIRSVVDITVAGMVSTIERLGAKASFNQEARLLTVNGALIVSIGSARGVSEGDGHVRWHVRVNRYMESHLALVIRMDRSNATIQDYFLLSSAELAKTTVKRLRISSRVFADSSRHDSLDAFYRMCISKRSAD